MTSPESYIFKLSAIIVRSFREELPQEERDFLDHWLQAGEKNRSLYAHMQEETWLEERMIEALKIDSKGDCEDFRKRYNDTKKRHTRNLILRCAAMILLLISIGIGYWYLEKPESDDIKLSETSVPVNEKEVVLILGNGERLILWDADTMATREESGTLLNIGGNQLSYQQLSENSAQRTEYNELYIPRGAEYFLILADGTKVWLNSESKLRYPVAFNGRERLVYLEGEAFFNVTENKEHPFIVNAGNSKTEVLGTEFNLRAYPDEAVVSTTLVKGSVRLSVGEESQGLVLSPGEQGNVMKTNGTLSKHSVDIYLYTAWKDGRLVFKSSRMEDLLNVLARWYNVEISCPDPSVKDIRFTGDLCKTEHVDTLLNIIEQNGLVVFECQGDRIVVKVK